MYYIVHMFARYIQFFSSRRRHTRYIGDWSSAVCSADLNAIAKVPSALRPLIGNAMRLMPPAVWDGAARAIPAARRPKNMSYKVAKLARLLEHDGEEALYLHLVSQWNAPQDLVLGGTEPTGLLNDPSLKAKIRDFVSRMQYADTLTYLPDDILPKVDRASMSVGLEVRVPLLDHRVRSEERRVG